MNTVECSYNLREKVAENVPNVFSTMLAVQVNPLNEKPPAAEYERISGTVGVAGDKVSGAIYLHLPWAFAIEAARNLLGVPAGEAISESDVNDIVGELTNMVAGGLKSDLCNTNWPCAISTPSIIRGHFDIEITDDVVPETFYFDYQGHHILVEVHLKLD